MSRSMTAAVLMLGLFAGSVHAADAAGAGTGIVITAEAAAASKRPPATRPTVATKVVGSSRCSSPTA